MTENKNLIKRTFRYKFTLEELQQRLGIEGNIVYPRIFEARVEEDDDIYFIETEIVQNKMEERRTKI
jgi:hypothetical protein